MEIVSKLIAAAREKRLSLHHCCDHIIRRERLEISRPIIWMPVVHRPGPLMDATMKAGDQTSASNGKCVILVSKHFTPAQLHFYHACRLPAISGEYPERYWWMARSTNVWRIPGGGRLI